MLKIKVSYFPSMGNFSKIVLEFSLKFYSFLKLLIFSTISLKLIQEFPERLTKVLLKISIVGIVSKLSCK